MPSMHSPDCSSHDLQVDPTPVMHVPANVQQVASGALQEPTHSIEKLIVELEANRPTVSQDSHR